MRRLLLTSLLVLAAAAATPRGLAAQGLVRTNSGETIERIAAIAGDSVITLTELQEYVLTLRAQGQLPTDPAVRAEIEDQALESLVDQMLIMQEAGQDSTLLPDDVEIEGRVSQLMESTIAQVGGAAAFQAALEKEGVTQAEYRELMKQRVRREQIRQLFMASKVREAAPVAVTEAEARRLYEESRAQIGQRPEMLTIRQIVIRPQPSEEAWTAAKDSADKVLADVRAGRDFGELAGVHSADPSSASGGDLGWFRRGMMVREFEEVAFRLPAGQVSEPTRTEYGWHIIKVERTRPGEVNARHILIRPQTGTAADDRARAQADEVARRARAGEDFRVLLTEFEPFHEAAIPDSVQMPRAQAAEALPPEYQQPLTGVTQGEIIGPFAFNVRAQTAWVVVEVTEVKAAGAPTFEELRPSIDSQLSEQRQIERILNALRERYYVEIRN